MNPNDLATRYHLLNSSFKKTMIYHIGIDAGFFTEYTYMLHAMLYCLQHKIQFKLYSDDANFGWEKGWEDCFAPFCEQVHEPFHHTYNTHRLPSWQALMKDKKLPKTKLLKWKLKVTCKNIIGKALAFFTYGKPVRLNFQVTFNPNQHFHIPELGIDGDYLHTFQKLTEITWKLNDTAACLLIRREIYDEMNGLDESYAVAFNDVDFCVRVREAGYTNVFTPFAQLYHYESKSRGTEDNPEKQKRFQGEVLRFQARWGDLLAAGDPCTNPNFDIQREDFTLKILPLE